MAKTDFKNIDQYHQTFSGDVLERMQSIRALVHAIAPEVEEVISYQIPAFRLGSKHYLIYYCAFKNHLTLSGVWSDTFLKMFENDLKDLKVSKSAIQFSHNKPLPLDLIKKILKFRKEAIESILK
jgi:uncharacterized protein YdhG (YjbR/CyaY superfamily)